MQDPEFRQFIERVKLRTPIEVVVGERVSGLKARGGLHWACCPFHQERTPSFAVDPRRGTWRCFGACGEGGDVISFVERFDGSSFLETLRLLAHQCGEPFPERSGRRLARGSETQDDARYALLDWAARLYAETWRAPEASGARAYARRRGLTDATLEAFGVGWAPEGGQFLVQAAQRQKKALDGLIEAGLVRRSESGRVFDFFRGRLLIPIRDRVGRPVGFGGRRIDEPGPGSDPASLGPKYVNTPETPLFHKGRLIYGLDQAAAAIRGEHRLLVVEGYTDVMAAHQAGWKSAVAVLGTSTTEDHAALIRRSGARTVVLVFDGDEAGHKAALRALAGLLKLPVELRVAELPPGQDPGDLLVTAEGQGRFRACVDEARDWFDWSLEALRGLRGPELARSVEERFELLVRLGRPVERSTRLKEMADFLGIPEADVRAQWALFERGRRPAQAVPAPAPAPAVARPRPRAVPSSAESRAYGLLIGALLLDNSLVPLYAGLADSCPEGDLSVLLRTLLALYERDDSAAPIDASALMTALGEHPARMRAVALQDEAARAESPDVLARDQARWIERARVDRELEALKTELDHGAEDERHSTLERLHSELRSGRVPQDPALRT